MTESMSYAQFFLGSLLLAAALLGYFLALMVLRRREEALLASRKPAAKGSPPVAHRPAPASVQKTGGGRSSSSPPRGRSSGQTGLIVSGFDREGNKVYIQIASRELRQRKWGVVLGRDITLSDYPIPDPGGIVSRRHFRIRFDASEGSLVIEDLGTPLGTQLNGAQLRPFQPILFTAPARLSIGDLIVLTLTET